MTIASYRSDFGLFLEFLRLRARGRQHGAPSSRRAEPLRRLAGGSSAARWCRAVPATTSPRIHPVHHWIPDYWVVNLIDSALEVYRDPVIDADTPYGWRYASPAILGPGGHVTPLAAPSARIAVSDLLP